MISETKDCLMCNEISGMHKMDGLWVCISCGYSEAIDGR